MGLLLEKLDSISRNTVELENLLNQKCNIIFSWGQRRVSIDGFVGSVKIDLIAKKSFPHIAAASDLIFNEDRFRLLEKIRNLYIESDKKLASEQWIFRIWVQIRDALDYVFSLGTNPRERVLNGEFIGMRNTYIYTKGILTEKL